MVRLQEHLASQVAGAKLLTSDTVKDQERVFITDGEESRFAYYDNGILFVQHGLKGTSDYMAVVRKIRKYKGANAVITPIQVQSSDIADAYRDALSNRQDNAAFEDDSTASERLERQEMLAGLIEQAAKEGATDIRILILPRNTDITIRVHGRLKTLSSLDPTEGLPLIKAAFAVASDTGSETSTNSWMQGALTKQKSGILPKGIEMLRLQYSHCSEGRGALVMRLKYTPNTKDVDIDSLGYSPTHLQDFQVMRTRTNGGYVLAGKVSSGKTTTLQRTLNKMTREKRGEISSYSIESPVELDLPSAIQVPVKNDEGFIKGLEAALRSDPNVIILGETRSKGTAYLALQAVMTGHALWTTVHAGSALGILDRMVDLGVEDWKLSDEKNIRGLIYQRLVGVMCPHCRMTLAEAFHAGEMDVELGNKLVHIFGDSEGVHVRGDTKPDCPHKCKKGLVGRTVVAETCLTDGKLLSMFVEGKRRDMLKYWTTPRATDGTGGLGGKPVLHHALAKCGAGLVDPHEIQEEVDLIDTYLDDFEHLIPTLREDVLVMTQATKDKAA